jgi:hypothetical protein
MNMDLCRFQAARLRATGTVKGRSERSERSYKTGLPLIRNAAFAAFAAALKPRLAFPNA